MDIAPHAPAADGRVTHLLYLHGFRSSPQSAKARHMAARVAARHPAVHWWCPQLPPSPREAMEAVMQRVAAWPADRTAVVGSSLGGFYATHVAETLGCRAVLLNPAVDPARDLARYIGEQTAWHDPAESFYFEPRYVDELRALAHGPLANPARYLAVIAKGDEVLDWREMTTRYAGARIKLLDASDHALSDFDDHIDEIFDFLHLAVPA
ncbi:MAG: alpha/beta fold hydrolase [Burkholderiales bacterium]|nr:alpha/beta fold hydrolase [Burkholderiales bacterium]